MVNKYPGRCDSCGIMVEAHAGTLHRVNNKWVARHAQCHRAPSAYVTNAEAARGVGELERAYDEGMNEGGEGYNPYRQKRELADLE